MTLPNQIKLNNSVGSIPIEYFKWGSYPDHFKIDMPHRHSFSELLFFTKGGATHEVNYNDYLAQKGSIHFIPKSTVHFLKRDKNSEGFTIAFDDRYLESNDTHKFINPLPEEPFHLVLKDAYLTKVLDQSKVILSQIQQNDSYYREKCFLLSIELLMNTLAAEISNVPIRIESKNTHVEQFKYLVKTNIHQHHNVAWYASELQVSSKTLGNVIKTHLGKSPKKYLQEILLISVKRNLIDSNKSIKEIAIDHNYNLSQLGKLFKKNVQYTMREYRSG